MQSSVQPPVLMERRERTREGGRAYLGSGLDVRLVADGLRAVLAIFRAAARLDGKEGALLDFLGVPVHAVHGGGLIKELDERLVVQGLDFRAGPVLVGGREGRREGGKEGGKEERTIL